MRGPPTSSAPLVQVLLAQVLGAGTAGLLAAWTTDGVGLIAPALGAFAAAFALLWLRLGDDPAWLDRPALRRVAARSGLAGWGLGTLAYAASWAQAPGLYEFGPMGLLVAAPAVGLLAGFAGLLIPLCAADAAGLRVGGLQSGDQPEQEARVGVVGGRPLG